MVERQGKLNAKVVLNTNLFILTKEIIKCVRDLTNIYTDEYLGYNRISQFCLHTVVKHKLSQYVDGSVFTNSIESFWSLVKRRLLGIYHFASKTFSKIP